MVIKKADFKIRDNETDSIAELKNIKVYISISDFYKSDTFKIKKITVSKANLYLNSLSLTNFIQTLKKSVVIHFVIKNSTLFFKDKKNEIILISKIKNLDYKNDFVNKKKILKIDGIIFDVQIRLWCVGFRKRQGAPVRRLVSRLRLISPTYPRQLHWVKN